MAWTEDIALRSIYIDFEGEGLNGDDEMPEPHLLGAYCSDESLGDNGYRVFFHRENWGKAARGSHRSATIQPLQQALKELIEEVEASDAKLAYWSDHERKVVEQFAGSLLPRFEANSVNVLTLAKKFCNRNGIELPKAQRGEKRLNDYLTALEIGIKPVEAPKLGAAELCRRLDNYKGLSRRWRNWSEGKQQQLRGLVQYNREDCIATSKIAFKVAG